MNERAAAIGGLKRTSRGEERAEAKLRRNTQREARDLARWEREKINSRTDALFNHSFGSFHLQALRFRQHSIEWVVRNAVRANGMALGMHAPQLAPARIMRATHVQQAWEEARLHAVFLKQGPCGQLIGRVPIVEGEHHARSPVERLLKADYRLGLGLNDAQLLYKAIARQ